jgi:hypothetical protein
VKCSECKQWLHEGCSMYLPYCSPWGRILKRREMQKKRKKIKSFKEAIYPDCKRPSAP